MTEKIENISFSLQESCSDKNDKNIVSYEDLVREVDLMEMSSIIGIDDYITLEVDYQTNYLKKDLRILM